MEWIPVEERLPRPGMAVLVTKGKKEKRCVEVDVYAPSLRYLTGKDWMYDDVTAWMPLPDAYKPE